MTPVLPQPARSPAAVPSLDAYPDAGPALEVLAEATVPAFARSNGSSSTVATLFERAGLAPLVSLTGSAEDNGSLHLDKRPTIWSLPKPGANRARRPW